MPFVKKSCWALWGTLLFSSLALADRVDEIRIVGNKRTRDWVVKNILDIKEGDDVSKLQLKKAVQEVKNMDQISDASGFFITEGKKRILVVEIDEKWTLLPYFKGNIHGAKKTYSAGLVEANILGTLIEGGLIYENNNGRSGGTLLAHFPKELGWFPAKINFDLSKSTDDVSVYDLNSTQVGAYRSETFKTKLEFDFKLNRRKTISFISSLGYSSLDINQSNLSSSDNAVNAANNFREANHDERFTLTNAVVLGKVDKLNTFQDEGTYWLTAMALPFSLKQSLLSPVLETTFQFYLPARWTSMWAVRARAIRTFESGLFDILDTASLSNIRGYKGSQFQGEELWSFNAEYRIPSFKHKWIGIQHVLFADGLYSRFPHYGFLSKEQRALATGVGLRIMLPKIYKVMGRIDYTIWGDPKPSSQFSMSMQQFF